MEKILIVDDEPLMRSFLTEALSRKGYKVESAENGKKATLLLRAHSFDLILTDLRMEEMHGIDLLRFAKELHPKTLVILMTAHGTIENAVEAMRLGALNYILKPFTLNALEAILEKAREHHRLVEENSYLREEGVEKTLIAESPLMKEVIDQALKIAKSSASVLLQGESGTGKEVLAHLIHTHSFRAKAPYIKVNCAAIPDTLIESEFFGHEKGAFTGAQTKRTGRFELADKGTLFLDEVTEIPLMLQPKLLRVLQEGEFERVGGTRSLSVDVRLISSTNRNPKEAILEKILREDLYYRLNVIPLVLPALRERREDILPLARHFIEKHCGTNHKKKKSITAAAEQKLLDYRWPGNVRELSNVIERCVVLNLAATIDASDIRP